jgi:predicted transposase YbfD/YdcC
MKIDKKVILLQKLKNLTDFRKDKHKIEYPLHEIIFMSLFGLLKGFVTFTDLQTWMQYQENNEIFKKLFKKEKINIPSRSTLHNLLINIDNNELEVVFRNHFEPYINLDNIAIDGKWLRGSDITGQYTQESHKCILNMLDKDVKIVIAHKFLEKGKLSEIPAFQELLEDKLFSKASQIFSFDALLTQVNLLNTINESGRRYIAKVKGNQEGLKNKAKEVIANFKADAKSFHDTILHHWRVETYHYHLDILTKEDDHIAYVNPFSVSILRGFAVNLYQLYLNAHKGEKIMKSKVTMAEIKRTCNLRDDFTSNIFELEP